MTAAMIELGPRQMRRSDALEAGSELELFRKLLELVADRRSVRQPQRQPLADRRVDGEQAQLPAELAMVGGAGR